MAELRGRLSRFPHYGVSAGQPSAMKFARIVPVLLALSALPTTAWADDAEQPTDNRPLPVLPVPTPITLPPPDDESRAELEAWLARLTNEDPAIRKQAIAEIESASRSMIPAIADKISEIREAGRLNAMAALLSQARKKSGTESTDWFDRVMAAPRPGDPAWRDLASLLGCSRLLVQIGTVQAARQVVALYPTFDELLRIDVQRQITKLGDQAVPALIEARRAETREVRRWARRQLDALGRGTPGEAVQAADEQLLPELLRAYGRSRDIDAARVIVSFANSDRDLLREAAREAVVMLAENSLWPLREAYEALLGTRASEQWGWERTARELFAAFDRARLADVYARLDAGLEAWREGRLDEMVKAFDAVSARAPKLDRRPEMAAGYFDYARSRLENGDRANALAYLRRALRLGPDDALAAKLRAELTFLETEDLEKNGLVDIASYQRALELDPTHSGARAALERHDEEARLRKTRLQTIAAVGSALLATLLGGLAWFAKRR